MNKSKVWHEDDSFWEITAASMFSREIRAAAPGEVEKLISLLDIKDDEHILYLCCGVGRHTIEFAKRGYTVTGSVVSDSIRKRSSGHEINQSQV